MPKYILLIIEFLIAFILVYSYHRIVIIKKYKKYKNDKLKNKDKYKIPSELILFGHMIGKDLREGDATSILNTLAIVNSIDIGLILILTEVTKSLILKLVIALISCLIIVIFSYKLLGKYYMKKERKNQNEL